MEKTINGCQLVQITGEWQKGEEKTVLRTVDSTEVIFKMVVDKYGRVSFLFGKDESAMEPVGDTVGMTPGRWVGVKAGLFIINKTNESHGYIKSDYFIFEP